jgi:hypothetical protein
MARVAIQAARLRPALLGPIKVPVIGRPVRHHERLDYTVKR